MTTRWITNPRDRRTKKYRDIHLQLKREVQQDRYVPRPLRHKIASEAFRQQREATQNLPRQVDAQGALSALLSRQAESVAGALADKQIVVCQEGHEQHASFIDEARFSFDLIDGRWL